jgi:hypothetical protein
MEVMISPDPNRAGRLKYAIIGDDVSSTEEKLAKYSGRVGWSYLKPHYLSGSLWFVDSGLALEEVGAALSADDRNRVQAWLKAGDLVKIGDLHAAQWEKRGVEFDALVVSPFVLCRPSG